MVSAPEPLALVVGLGNPGPRYERTRHNVGASAVSRLAALLKLRFRRSADLNAAVARNETVALARPDTFMNSVGPTVARLVGAFGAGAPLVVSDDLDLPLGTIRFRTRGSAGGHRGVASIIEALGTGAFPRLKIGIGRPAGGDARDYVLDEFTGEDRKTCDRVLDRAAAALHVAVTRGLDRAMTEYSK